MKASLVDTNILSLFFRGHPHVVAKAEVYANLRKSGKPIDDIDLLIAGTAIANGLILVTDNRKHFDRIVQLEIENWAEPFDPF